MVPTNPLCQKQLLSLVVKLSLRNHGDRCTVMDDRPVVMGDRPVVMGDRPIVMGDRPIVMGDLP